MLGFCHPLHVLFRNGFVVLGFCVFDDNRSQLFFIMAPDHEAALR